MSNKLASTWIRSCVAGPSRSTPLSSYIPRNVLGSVRLASTTHKSSPARHNRPTGSKSIPPPLPSPPNVGSASVAAWPWRPIQNPGPQDNQGGNKQEYERIIYARPFEGPRPRMLLFFIPFWGLVVGFYLTTPTPEKRYAPGEEPPEAKKEAISDTFLYYGKPVGIFAMTLGAFFVIFYPSRVITRLSLVRRPISSSPTSLKPSGSTAVTGSTSGLGSGVAGGGQMRDIIRINHGAHLMLPEKYQIPREVTKEDITVSFIGVKDTRSSYLNFHIKPKKKLSFDSFNYRLDFRDTKALQASDGEVVLSLSRIEQVFGKLKVNESK